MRTRPQQLSYSSGEISPLLFARTDYQRFQTGLRSCRGYLPLRQGGITRAPGTIARGNTLNNTIARRITFQFAANDSLELEFTDGKMRVWRYGALVQSGGSPYELVTPYDEDAIARLQYVQSADVIYLVDGILPMQRLARLALDNWSIGDAAVTNGPFRVQNLNVAKTMRVSADLGAITVTGTGNIFDATWVGSLVQLKPTDISNIPIWTGNTVVAVNELMRYDGRIYQVDTGTNTSVNPPIHDDGVQKYGRTPAISWRFVSDEVGIFRITGYTNSNSVSAVVVKRIPIPLISEVSYRWSEGAWSDRRGYPKSVELEDQSLFAGFTANEPRTLWKSTLGAFLDFEPMVEADSSFGYTIGGSKSLNGGNWLLSAKRGIYIGSLGEVRRGYSVAADQVIGPTTFKADIEATEGSTAALPIQPFGYPIFVSKDGGRLFELRYSFDEDGGKPIELSLPSQHLGLLGFEQIVWQAAPIRIGWIRQGNGEVAILIYDPDEDVLGWARYPVAGGFVEDITVTASADARRDIVTFTVRRTINGQTVRLIEEQADLWGAVAGNTPIYKAVHLFASSVFDLGVATDTFSVPHLEGETVYVWTNQGQYGPLVVPVGGDVVIDEAVTHAVVGLFDATHEFETLSVVAAAKDGASWGRQRRLQSGSGAVLHRTAAGKIQGVERDFEAEPRYGDLEDLVRSKVAADLDTAYSGVKKLEIKTGHADDVTIRGEPVGGAPMTLLALIPNIEEVGG